MRQLGKEVAKRLTAVNMRGRSLTLKVMKRHPDAPKEAAKVRLQFSNSYLSQMTHNGVETVPWPWRLRDIQPDGDSRRPQKCRD